MTSMLEPAILCATSTGEGVLPMAKSLDKYREERYMTQREFAQVLGITQRTYIALVKHGRRAHPTTMRRIAEVLGVAPSEIAEFARKPSSGEESAAEHE